MSSSWCRTRHDRDTWIRSGRGPLVALLAVACARTEALPPGSDAAAAPVDVAPARVLCDGSAGPRLVYANRGGFVSQEFRFYSAYGHEFFVITGDCRFWAGADYLKGIRTGTLDAAAAATVASQLHHADFASLPASSGMDCPDASVRTLGDGARAVDCHCTCPQDGPPAVREVFTNLSDVLSRLLAAPAAELPIRVMAYPRDGKPGPTDPVLAWPLPWSPAEGVPAMLPTPDSGKLVTAPEELTALRALRMMAVQKMMFGGLPVETAAKQEFVVYPRDEAPTAVVQALDGLGF
jgi:hypothetical protein